MKNEVSKKTILAATAKMIDGKMIKLKPYRKEPYKKAADCLFSSWMYICSLKGDGTGVFCTKSHFIFDGHSLDDFEV